MGIIRLAHYEPAHPIHLVVELTDQETERLPMEKYYEYSNTKTKLFMLKSPHVPSLLLALTAVREGRMLPQDALLTREAS
jgi:hypothetical protein